jgi:hypothetical protein
LEHGTLPSIRQTLALRRQGARFYVTHRLAERDSDGSRGIHPTDKETKWTRRVATIENRYQVCHLRRMANTYTSLHYHVIFSTKNREPWLADDFAERIWEFLGGIARENGMKALLVGGMPDHIHLALALRLRNP